MPKDADSVLGRLACAEDVYFEELGQERGKCECYEVLFELAEGPYGRLSEELDTSRLLRYACSEGCCSIARLAILKRLEERDKAVSTALCHRPVEKACIRVPYFSEIQWFAQVAPQDSVLQRSAQKYLHMDRCPSVCVSRKPRRPLSDEVARLNAYYSRDSDDRQTPQRPETKK